MKGNYLASVILIGLALLAQACGPGAATVPPVPPATNLPAQPQEAQQEQPVQPALDVDIPGGFLIQSLENTLLVVDASGQSTPFFPADRPLNSPVFQTYSSSRTIGSSLYGVSVGDQGQSQAYVIDPNGMRPLEFAGAVYQGLALWRGSESQPPRLAWDQLNVNPETNTASSRLLAGNADGSDTRTLLEEAGAERVLVAGRWSRDGQRLYFSKEPLGLGGYIAFSGASNLWAYNLADGSSALVVNDPGLACIDDLSWDETLLAHHCANPRITVIQVASGTTTTIDPPAGVEPNFSGSARFSSDGQRVAFGIARGNPDNEQGWVAVSDGLSGASRLIATAPAGEYFHVIGWLDADTLVLQSWGVTPGVWLVNTDGSGLVRMADGIYHGLVN